MLKPRVITLDRLSFIVSNLNKRVCDEVNVSSSDCSTVDVRKADKIKVTIGVSIYIIIDGVYDDVRNIIKSNWNLIE